MTVTPIFSYTPQNATLIAGLLVGFSTASTDPDSSTPAGTWSAWNGLTDIGDIGNSGSFIEQTTLADTTKRYISGMKDTQEIEMTYYKYAFGLNVNGKMATLLNSRLQFPDMHLLAAVMKMV